MKTVKKTAPANILLSVEMQGMFCAFPRRTRTCVRTSKYACYCATKVNLGFFRSVEYEKKKRFVTTAFSRWPLLEELYKIKFRVFA